MSPDPAASSDRRSATAVPGITALRFLPDRTAASLVNISPTGLLAESGAPARVGSPAILSFEGGFTPETVTGRVARCEVAAMGPDGLLRYLVGVEFDSPLEFGDVPPGRAPGPVPATISNRW